MSPFTPLLCQLSAILAFGALADFRSWANENSSRQEAGKKGEERVDDFLRNWNEVEHVSNIVLSRGMKTLQIDHIVKGKNCLYVIETKNWRGVLSGELTDRQWKLAKVNGTDSTHYNPLMQGQKHATELAKLTGIPVESLIVMTNQIEHISGKLPWGVVRFKRLKGILTGKLKNSTSLPVENQALEQAWSIVLQLAENENNEIYLRKHLAKMFDLYTKKPWRIWIAASLLCSAIAMLLSVQQ